MDLNQEILDILRNEGKSGLSYFNTSYIFLIAKKEGAKEPKDYRPISFLSSIQRLFSKILSNRLKPYINEMIDVNQLGFLEGRNISENYIYAREVLYTAKRERTPIILFKADIHKAFDSISWEFLIKVLKARGFGPNWIEWIENSVLKGSTRILLNGIPGKYIHLKKGLRQGDPLSTDLFIIVMDVLSRIVENLSVKGYLIKPIENIVSSILYADDTMFFLMPDLINIKRLKHILDIFGNESGLKINFNKSEIIGVNVTEESLLEISNELNCPIGTLPMNYLGLPLHYKRPSKDDFRKIVDKFNNKLEGWKSGLLSVGGRLILINSVLSSLSNYYMGIFKLPKWVIKDIDKVRRNFLWKGTNNKGYNLANWSLVCKPRSLGGMGVLNLEFFNASMLIKWIWKYCTMKESSLPWNKLMSKPQLIGTKNINHDSNYSYFWNDILKNLNWFRERTKFTLGRGDLINLWTDKWNIDKLIELMPQFYSFIGDNNMTVQMIMEDFNDNEEWLTKLKLAGPLSQMAEEQIKRLQSMLANVTITPDSPDLIHWIPNLTKGFSVSTCYKEFFQDSKVKLNNIWKLKIPLRFKVFCWLSYYKKILTIDNLKKRGWELANRCELCKKEEESVVHLLSNCEITKEIWGKVNGLLDLSIPALSDPFNAMLDQNLKIETRELIAVFMSNVWRERCRRIFQGIQKRERELIELIIEEFKLYQKIFREKKEESIFSREEGEEEEAIINES